MSDSLSCKAIQVGAIHSGAGVVWGLRVLWVLRRRYVRNPDKEIFRCGWDWVLGCGLFLQ